MASIYIVNHTISGMYPENWSYYHHTEKEAIADFVDCKASAGDEPTRVELIRLNTETLEAVTITGWEGTMDDLEDEEDDEVAWDENAAEMLSRLEPIENDDWVVEGRPEEGE